VSRNDERYTTVFLGQHLFTSKDIFAVGMCIVQPQQTAKNRTAEISVSGIAMGSVLT